MNIRHPARSIVTLILLTYGLGLAFACIILGSMNPGQACANNRRVSIIPVGIWLIIDGSLVLQFLTAKFVEIWPHIRGVSLMTRSGNDGRVRTQSSESTEYRNERKNTSSPMGPGMVEVDLLEGEEFKEGEGEEEAERAEDGNGERERETRRRDASISAVAGTLCIIVLCMRMAWTFVGAIKLFPSCGLPSGLRTVSFQAIISSFITYSLVLLKLMCEDWTNST